MSKGGCKMSEKTLGIMLDCSRNAVMKPEKVKEFAKTISEMGYNMLQLYTEDTYEIQGEPFWGYMRGRYTHEEVKDMATYCDSIGIELVPCIQVLAHLGQVAQWEPYAPLFECQDILMVGDEKVYQLIDKMFDTIEQCFTSRKVNVGMDEAFFIGRGKYLDAHGYQNRIDILLEHLTRVKEIADKHGFTIMMWSDMFIRLHNGGEYYGKEIQIPEETIAKVPEGIELIYWDYYSRDKSHYDQMFQSHMSFRNPIVFAGGLWTWTGYAPNLRFTWDTTKAAMESAIEHGIDNIIFTLWGDHGKDCSFYAALPMIYAAAQMAKGNFNQDDIAEGFEKNYGYTWDEYMNLELPNITKDNEEGNYCNPCKYLLFNDPFIGIFDYTVPSDLPERYEKAAETVANSISGRKYDYLFQVEQKLLEVLSIKADLGQRLRSAYQSDDNQVLKNIVEQDFPSVKKRIHEFAEAFRTMWLLENKPFGIEVQEQRIGGLLYRLETCEVRVKQYLAEEIDRIDELEEHTLVREGTKAGVSISWGDWKTTVTTCVN